ncbi:MAG: hypothetical protein K0S47_3798 [Herbinix sp.]|jgi:hypothetical protein|nr:hypothetical protein [Herbinix sp.]
MNRDENNVMLYQREKEEVTHEQTDGCYYGTEITKNRSLWNKSYVGENQPELIYHVRSRFFLNSYNCLLAGGDRDGRSKVI